MKNSAVLSAYAVLTVMSIALLVAGCDQRSASGNTVKVGVMAPLTGENATYGRSTREGVELAVQEINAAKTLGKPLEIVFEDDKMDPTEGVTAFRRLISTDHPAVVIGPFGSSVVLAVAPIANDTQTVIISASATADSIRDAGDFVFRITPPNSKQGADDAAFSFEKLKARKAAIIFQRNDYGQTLRDAFAKKFTELGGTIVDEEGLPDGTTDFRSALTNLAAKRPDVVFFPLHSQESTLTLRQARDLGLKMPFISGDGAMTPDLLQGAGPAAEGAYFSTLALGYGVSDQAIETFNRAFKAKYGKDPDVYAAYYYEVTKLVARAIASAGDNSKAVRDYFYAMHGDKAYKGITGVTAFDKNGEVNKSFYIYRVRNGKFDRYDQ